MTDLRVVDMRDLDPPDVVPPFIREADRNVIDRQNGDHPLARCTRC